MESFLRTTSPAPLRRVVPPLGRKPQCDPYPEDRHLAGVRPRVEQRFRDRQTADQAISRGAGVLSAAGQRQLGVASAQLGATPTTCRRSTFDARSSTLFPGPMTAIEKRNLRKGLLFCAPWFIGLGVFTAYPVLASLFYSFCDYSVLQSPLWSGLENYQRMVSDTVFWISRSEEHTSELQSP